ncbi:MAG: excalibur calcium-binding domain-containing protein [Salinivirgaceae bacterium]|nr:excalibur calcium-binding domain-containing protein [Salinivirgaceae bacterium]
MILTEEKPSTVGEESLLSKMRKAFTLGGSSGNDSPTSNTQYRCNGRTYCSQMTSCEEATFFLENCPGVKMDGNKDGVPCERQWCR